MSTPGMYAVPEGIRRIPRPQGTIIKRQGDRFYVYQQTSTKIKKQLADGTFKWQTANSVGKCIGRVTEQDGFISNLSTVTKSEITVLEYGCYAFLLKGSESTLTLLKEHFNINDANRIYVLASIFVIEGFAYMKEIKELFDMSYLKLKFSDVHVGYDALHEFCINLGRRSSLPDSFQQKLIDDSSKRVAIDGHVIACTSEKNDLSAFGYKASKLGCAQINWMCAYDIQNGKPLVNQMVNGSDLDKTAVQILFSRFNFINTRFVVDHGFNTAKDKELMSENGNSFIVPMISNCTDYRYVYDNLNYDKQQCSFIYDKNGYSSLIYYQNFNDVDGKRCIAYLDTTRQYSERKSYINKLLEGGHGYSEESLKASEKDFGLFILETSDFKATPEQIFTEYKARWGIESFYNYIDNELDFNASYQQDYCATQGLSFIVQVASLIYHDLKLLSNSKNLTVKDIMRDLRGIKLVKERERWVIRNDIKRKRELCETIGVQLPAVLPAA